MRLLVFQHIPIEHPGVFREFLQSDGHAVDTIELDAGDAIPPLEGFDALWVFGGPMDADEEERYPWLAPEKAAIREAVVDRAMPFLGVCLGHQLLAEALGGRVTRMAVPEIGVLDVALTPQSRRDPLLAGFDETMSCLQWHGSEVSEMPPGGVHLLRSDACETQAFRVGHAAYGLQFHIELTERTVPEWGQVPVYAESLERASGPGALARLEADAASGLPAFNRCARRIYDNFMKIAAGARRA